MKHLGFSPILFFVSTTIALGDHGTDPLAEIERWQIVAIAVLAAAVFLVVALVKKRTGHRKDSRTVSSPLSDDEHAP